MGTPETAVATPGASAGTEEARGEGHAGVGSGGAWIGIGTFQGRRRLGDTGVHVVIVVILIAGESSHCLFGVRVSIQ